MQPRDLDASRFGILSSRPALTHNFPESFAAVKQRNRLEHLKDHLEGAKDALEMRKYSIEDLLKLFFNNYYAEPRVPKGADRSVVRDAQKDKVIKTKEEVGG